jgi:hypothetical protein
VNVFTWVFVKYSIGCGVDMALLLCTHSYYCNQDTVYSSHILYDEMQAQAENVLFLYAHVSGCK